MDIFNFCYIRPSVLMASVRLRFPNVTLEIPTDSLSALLSYIFLLEHISAVTRDECLLQDKIKSNFLGNKMASSLFGPLVSDTYL